MDRETLTPKDEQEYLRDIRAEVHALTKFGYRPGEVLFSPALLDKLEAHMADLRARLNAAEQRWQPIETAPKDGSLVLLLRELARADLKRSQYIEVLEDLVDQAQTALDAAKEDELRTRGEGQTGADSGDE